MLLAARNVHIREWGEEAAMRLHHPQTSSSSIIFHLHLHPLRKLCNLKLCLRRTNTTIVISCSPHCTGRTIHLLCVCLYIYLLSLTVLLRCVVCTRFFIAIIHFIAMSFYFVAFNSISLYRFFFSIVCCCCCNTLHFMTTTTTTTVSNHTIIHITFTFAHSLILMVFFSLRLSVVR